MKIKHQTTTAIAVVLASIFFAGPAFAEFTTWKKRQQETSPESQPVVQEKKQSEESSTKKIVVDEKKNPPRSEIVEVEPPVDTVQQQINAAKATLRAEMLEERKQMLKDQAEQNRLDAEAKENKRIADAKILADAEKAANPCRVVTLTIPAYDAHLDQAGHSGAKIRVTLKGVDAEALQSCNPGFSINEKNGEALDVPEGYAVVKVGYAKTAGTHLRIPVESDDIRFSFKNTQAGIKDLIAVTLEDDSDSIVLASE